MAEVLREPALPASEFEQLKQENYAAIEQQKSEPDAVAHQRVQPPARIAYPKGDVRYIETPDEALASYKAATLDDAKKFHADFYGASVGELAVVGDFDPKETLDLVTRLFGDWKSPRAFERVPSPYQDAAAVERVVRDAGQGERLLHRRRRTSRCETTTRTTRRSCSGTTCSAAAS